MNMRLTLRVIGMAWLGMVWMFSSSVVRADEGMWLFNNPPRKLLKERYQFDPSAGWLEHLQKASVRFNSGGSGSFVSPQGLVMTNHHVGADALQKLSTAQRDLLGAGYIARKPADELKCVDLELNVLMEIEDVTERVNAAVKPEMPAAEAEQARRGVMNTIEKESLDATGLRSDVVTLYQGGLYHLYRFKRYTDVRLVFAPEKAIAFFGGDPDNFEYPRYDLDVCFFRAYEDDQPAEIEHYLKWSKAGADDGELVFVSGHPGRTNRLNTVEHLEFLRDSSYPFILNHLRRLEVLLGSWGERSAENARRSTDDLFGVKNSRKARLGMLAGLQDPAVMQQKRQDQTALRERVAADPKLQALYGDAWELVAASLSTAREMYLHYLLLEQGLAFNSELFQVARTLVRLGGEDALPNEKRLREYRASNRASLELQLFSAAPIHADLETVKLADSLSLLAETLGAGDALVELVLAGKSPQERAAQLVAGCKLADTELRRKLAEGKEADLDAAEDPMIELARIVDPAARAFRKRYEEEVEEPQRQAYAKIAGARFATEGTSNYPDATFTLRLAYGVVKGYQEQGRTLPPWTVLDGAFEHADGHDNREPFQLPKRWLDRRQKLDGQTPYNFVSTADIIGGNSGSPVVNRAGELVGIIFDGNIQSLVLAFAFTEEQARATSVHSSGIREALLKIYDAKELGQELGW